MMMLAGFFSFLGFRVLGFRFMARPRQQTDHICCDTYILSTKWPFSFNFIIGTTSGIQSLYIYTYQEVRKQKV